MHFCIVMEYIGYARHQLLRLAWWCRQTRWLHTSVAMANSGPRSKLDTEQWNNLNLTLLNIAKHCKVQQLTLDSFSATLRNSFGTLAAPFIAESAHFLPNGLATRSDVLVHALLLSVTQGLLRTNRAKGNNRPAHAGMERESEQILTFGERNFGTRQHCFRIRQFHFLNWAML